MTVFTTVFLRSTSPSSCIIRYQASFVKGGTKYRPSINGFKATKFFMFLLIQFTQLKKEATKLLLDLKIGIDFMFSIF